MSKAGARPFSVLFYPSLLAILYWLASGMLRPAVALYAADRTSNPALIGLVVSLQAFLPLFIAMPVGHLTDRLGFHLSAAMGAAGMFAAGLLYLGTPGLSILALAQSVSGIGELFMWTGLQAFASRMGEGESGNKQELYIGYFTLAVSVGQFFGPLLTGLLLQGYGYSVVFASFVGTAGALTILCWLRWFRDHPRHAAQSGGHNVPMDPDETSKMSPLLIARNPLVQASLASSFTMLFILGVFGSFFPILLRDHLGYSEAAVGVFLAIRTGGAFVIRPMMAFILRHFSLESTLLWSTAIAVVTLAIVPVFAHALLLGLVIFVGGLASGLSNPLTMFAIAKYTSVSQRGLGMGMRLFVNRAANVLSPLVFGGSAAAFGIHFGFYASGGLLSLVVVLIGYLVRKQNAPVDTTTTTFSG